MSKINIIALTDRQVYEAKVAIREYERTAQRYIAKGTQAKEEWQATANLMYEIYEKLKNPQQVDLTEVQRTAIIPSDSLSEKIRELWKSETK